MTMSSKPKLLVRNVHTLTNALAANVHGNDNREFDPTHSERGDLLVMDDGSSQFFTLDQREKLVDVQLTYGIDSLKAVDAGKYDYLAIGGLVNACVDLSSIKHMDTIKKTRLVKQIVANSELNGTFFNAFYDYETTDSQTPNASMYTATDSSYSSPLTFTRDQENPGTYAINKHDADYKIICPRYAHQNGYINLLEEIEEKLVEGTLLIGTGPVEAFEPNIWKELEWIVRELRARNRLSPSLLSLLLVAVTITPQRALLNPNQHLGTVLVRPNIPSIPLLSGAKVAGRQILEAVLSNPPTPALELMPLLKELIHPLRTIAPPRFGTLPAFSSIEEILQDFKEGKFVLVVDNEDRENEGDLIIAAEDVTEEQMAFLVRYSSGVVCAPMTGDILDRLKVPLMVPRDNKESHGTAFTITVDYLKGTTTGISAHDRTATVRALADPTSLPSDFAQPGHIFPLRYTPGGVLRRGGHTEAAVDLCKLAGKKSPVGVICEINMDDGRMARRDDLMVFARAWGIKMCTIAALVEYRVKHGFVENF